MVVDQEEKEGTKFPVVRRDYPDIGYFMESISYFVIVLVVVLVIFIIPTTTTTTTFIVVLSAVILFVGIQTNTTKFNNIHPPQE